MGSINFEKGIPMTIRDIAVKTTKASPLRWEHEELDKVCRNLPEFGSLVMVAQNPQDFELLRHHAEQYVTPKATADGISALSVRWFPSEMEFINNRILLDFIDAVIVTFDGENKIEIEKACATLESWPCAVILISRILPKSWTKHFDISLMFNGQAMLARSADGKYETKMKCDLHMGQVPKTIVSAPKKTQGPQPIISAPLSKIPTVKKSDQNSGTKALPPVEIPTFKKENQKETVVVSDQGIKKPRFVTFRVSKETTSLMQKTLSGFEFSNARLLNQIGENPEILLVQGSWAKDEIRKIIEQYGAKSSTILIGESPLRADDRVAAYRAGVRVVLPANASPEEIQAAIGAQLPHGSSRNPFENIDVEFYRLQERMRRQSSWRASEVEEATEFLQPLVENQMKRAALEGRNVGALIVALPQDLPTITGHKAFAQLIFKTLLTNILATLRSRDVGFALDGKLVVISYQMNSLTARAILKRLNGLLEELELPRQTQVRVLKAKSVDAADAPREARQFIRSIFAKA